MINTIIIRSLFLFSLLLFATNIYAIPIAGTTSGTFENPDGSSNMLVTGVGTDSFSWGVATSSNQPSSLMFSGNNSFLGNSDEEFRFGTLAYYNGTTISDTEATDVDLNVSLAFTNLGVTQDFSYSLTLVNTTNQVSAELDADIVYLPSTQPSSFFSVGGVDYTLEFLGFRTITGLGFFESVDRFNVYENASASAEMWGRITTTTTTTVSTVPEPSAFMLLVLGLMGLRFSLRKKA